MLSSINDVAENSLSNWSTSFFHVLTEKDSDAHSLDRYHYWHIQVFSTLLCQVSFPRSPIFLLRLLRLYRSGLIALWSWAVHLHDFSTLLCQVSFSWSSIFLLRLLHLYRSKLIALWPWAVHLLDFSTLLCQVSFHRSSIFLLHLLRLYHSELIALWAWAVHSQTMRTASKSRLYFWIAKIASSSYWLCVLLSENAHSERRRECIY